MRVGKNKLPNKNSARYKKFVASAVSIIKSTMQVAKHPIKSANKVVTNILIICNSLGDNNCKIIKIYRLSSYKSIQNKS